MAGEQPADVLGDAEATEEALHDAGDGGVDGGGDLAPEACRAGPGRPRPPGTTGSASQVTRWASTDAAWTAAMRPSA